MAVSTTVLAAPPERVFGVLEDPRSLAYFVVGSRKIRRFDPRWPELHTEVHHTVGIGPLSIRDTSEVVAVNPPSLLVLDARIRPFGALSVMFSIARADAGSTLTIEEHPVRGMLSWPAVSAIVDPLLTWRNRWMGRRVQRLVARREHQRSTARRHG